MIPVLVDPVGDPAGVRVGVGRLVAAAESLSVSARWLADSNQEAVLAWESNAQRLFSIMAETFSQVISGSAGVATEMGNALERYAGVVDQCQGEVRLCQQRLNELAAVTPPGFAPDQGTVNALVSQANNAYARVAQAAKELSAAALWMIGGSSGSSNVPMAGSAPGASFISHAHSAGLASTHPAAAGFDTQNAQIQAQLTGVLNSLAGHSAVSVVQPSGAPGSLVTVNRNSGPTMSGLAMVDPRYTNGELIFTPPAGESQIYWITPKPWSETENGKLWAAATASGNPRFIAAAQQVIDTEQAGVANAVHVMMEDSGAIQPGLENDIYKPSLDLNDDPYDNV